MGPRVRQIVRGVFAGVALGTIAFFATSKDARHRLDVAARAFRDPTLIEPRASAEAPVFITVPATGEGAELRLPGEFSPLPDDAEDPDTAAMRALVLPDIRVPITRRTMRFVRLFTKTESGRQAFLARYRRAGAYREIVERALRDAGLPEDVEWVAAIESGFDPRAVSPKGAAGLWQFMPETGMTYGLYQSPYVDERMNPVRSTRAAVSHLRDLYERFGRWDLALAAYNHGYDGVLRAMEKYMASPAWAARPKGAPIELSELAEAHLIPEETANYVPQIAAFAIVAANRSRFGLDVASLAPAPPLDLAEISVPEGTRLRTVARSAGMSTSSLRDYNPHLLRDRVPPTGGDFIMYVPSDRVQRTLISFPAFQDHEVIVDDEGDEPADEPPDPLAGPQPARPRNRLPVFAVPGHVSSELFGSSMTAMMGFNTKLPMVLTNPELGAKRQAAPDVLTMFMNGPPPRRGREAVLDAAAAALGPKVVAPLAPSDTFTLPSGVTVEIIEQPTAALVAITTRIAGRGEAAGSEGGPDLSGVSGVAPPEVRQTVTVGPRSLEAGIDLAVRRLRLTLAEGEGGASLRRAASAPYRHDLGVAPDGAIWLALGEALFPKGHTLEGTVITGRSDPGLYTDLMLAEQMRRERAPRRATISVAGDVTRARVQKALENALIGIQAGDPEIVPHPKEERVTMEMASRRLLYGWIGPAEGQPGHAAMRVAIEILAGQKGGRLRKAFFEDDKLATELTGVVESNPRAAVAAIDMAPAGETPPSALEQKLDSEIASLAEKGPTPAEVALARALIANRIEKARKAAQPSAKPAKGAPPPAPPSGAALPGASRVLLDPAAYDRLLNQLGEVAPTSVKLAATRLLAKDHRVVVIAGPKKQADPSNP